MLHAQDKIYLKDGSILRVKVQSVGKDSVSYRRMSATEGQDISIGRSEVDHIVFEDGSGREDDITYEMRYSRVPRRHREFGLSAAIGYGKNIVSLMPVHMANESPAGAGLRYERVLDKKNIFSIVLPVAFTTFNDHYNGSSGPNGLTDAADRTFLYFYPGVKIYPTGSNRPVSYGIGLCAVFASGTRYDKNYNIRTPTEVAVFKSGLMLNNSINLQPYKAVHVGLELGLGFLYKDNDPTRYPADQQPAVQFSFNIGYRF